MAQLILWNIPALRDQSIGLLIFGVAQGLAAAVLTAVVINRVVARLKKSNLLGQSGDHC